jgi:hypothetical protein
MHFIKGDIEGIASFILLAVALLTMPVSLIALIYGLRLRTSRRRLSGGAGCPRTDSHRPVYTYDLHDGNLN